MALTELSQLVGLALEELGGNCWKFTDSDMFCYEHDADNLYLAYIIDGGVAESDEVSDGAALARI